ncbi:hypothetical protein PERCYII29_2535 [Pseudomonas aeruginosa]|nr:hypothetical protein PERCYII29_2535 [Pseudomonas aeruginosa]
MLWFRVRLVPERVSGEVPGVLGAAESRAVAALAVCPHRDALRGSPAFGSTQAHGSRARWGAVVGALEWGLKKARPEPGEEGERCMRSGE